VSGQESQPNRKRKTTELQTKPRWIKRLTRVTSPVEQRRKPKLCRVKKLHGKKSRHLRIGLVKKLSRITREKTPSFKRSRVGSRESPELQAQWNNVESQSCVGSRNSTERKVDTSVSDQRLNRKSWKMPRAKALSGQEAHRASNEAALD
jgi:hypothetical protein